MTKLCNALLGTDRGSVIRPGEEHGCIGTGRSVETVSKSRSAYTYDSREAGPTPLV